MFKFIRRSLRHSACSLLVLATPLSFLLLLPSSVPCSFSALTSRSHSSFFSDWRRTVSFKFFNTQILSVSTRHTRCVFYRLRCIGHSLLLNSYLSGIDRIENPSSRVCGHPTQDTSHLIAHCPATGSLRRSLYGDSLSLYNLLSRS